jgi:hypothetical protein
MAVWKAYMQCSLEFTDPAAVPVAIEETIRFCNAFRTRCRWLHLNAYDVTPTVHQIPQNLPTLTAVNDWIFKSHTPPSSEVLGTIAADENRLVVNILHSVADSRYLVRLIEHLSNPAAYGTKNSSLLPSSAFNYFSKQISAREPLRTCATEPLISRVLLKKPLVPQKKSEFLINYLVEPSTALKSFDPKTRTSRKMTELMWTSLMLSTSAFNGQLMPAGLSTVVDLRRFLTPEQLSDNSWQNTVASIQIRADLTLDRTVEEVTKEMREQLELKIERGDWLGHMHTVRNCVFKPWIKVPPPPGLGIEMSSIGVINIKKPVKNALITMMCPGHQVYQGISFLNQSIRNLDEGTTTYIAQFQHTTQELNREDGLVLAESVRYALKNIGPEMRIGDAVEKVLKFQSTFR